MTKWTDLLKEAEAGGTFDPLPSGTYDVEVVKASHKVAQSGKSMFEVQFKVLTGPHANRVVWNRYVVSPENPKALGFFFSNMKALGLGTEFFSASPSDDQVANGLVGKSCRVELGLSEYQGTVRNEVKKTMPPEGGATVISAPAATAAPTFPAAAPAPAPTAPNAVPF